VLQSYVNHYNETRTQGALRMSLPPVRHVETIQAGVF
jgi:hypothetical protein